MSEQLAPITEEISKDIAAGRFRSEAEISNGVVQRILAELGWPIFDMQVVTPEFKIGGGARKVDYALCNPPGKAAILIEVKDLGKADGKGQKQLFEYCFHEGVPIAVLTDGRIWNFFYPPGQGSYEERRFARIDLLDHDHLVTASTLERYLNRKDVNSQEARKRAQQDYDEARIRIAAKEKFTAVWRKLLSEPAESLLLELFLEEVEKEMGIRPDPEEAASFIRRQATSKGSKEIPGPREPKPGTGIRENPRQASFTFMGQTQTFKSANELLGAVFSQFAKMDRDFCGNYSEKHAGKHKKYVARTREELNPKRPDLRNALPLPGGWYISTQCSNMQKLQWIKAACPLVGLRYGRDLTVNLPNA